MNINQEIKDKIVEKEIIKKEDIDNAPDWAIALAALLLEMSESDQYCSDSITKFDETKFLEEVYQIQDLIDLKNCDRVSQNYDQKMESFPLGVPTKLIPCLRNIMGEMKKGL